MKACITDLWSLFCMFDMQNKNGDEEVKFAHVWAVHLHIYSVCFMGVNRHL